MRTHEISEAHPQWRWRSGVVLEWLGARALVRLDRNERRTEVAVIGGTPEEHRSLFDIIRAHLTVLHGKAPVVEEVQALDDPEKWEEMRELRMAERDGDETIKVTVGTGTEETRVKLPVAVDWPRHQQKRNLLSGGSSRMSVLLRCFPWLFHRSNFRVPFTA